MCWSWPIRPHSSSTADYRSKPRARILNMAGSSESTEFLLWCLVLRSILQRNHEVVAQAVIGRSMKAPGVSTIAERQQNRQEKSTSRLVIVPNSLPPSASRLTAFTRSIFHFQPVTGSPRAIRRVLPLRHHALETQLAGGWDYFERALKFSLGDGVFAAHRCDTRDHPSSPRCVGVHFSE